jgi:hypothetical protein
VRALVIAFALGAAAVAIVVVVAALALGAAADAAGWSGFTVAVGPFVLVEFSRTPESVSTTLGSGIPLLALLGGFANAIVAAMLRRRLR